MAELRHRDERTPLKKGLISTNWSFLPAVFDPSTCLTLPSLVSVIRIAFMTLMTRRGFLWLLSSADGWSQEARIRTKTDGCLQEGQNLRQNTWEFDYLRTCILRDLSYIFSFGCAPGTEMAKFTFIVKKTRFTKFTFYKFNKFTEFTFISLLL